MSTPMVEYVQNGRIVELRLNRPDKYNAVNQQMVDELLDALYRIDADDEVWLAILTGNGKAFCAGADVVERIATPTALGFSPKPTINVLLSRFRNYKPVIAAVHGWAVGAGMVLALHCDMVVADQTARFQVSEVSRGIDGTVLWAPLDLHVDGRFADDLALTARVCEAQEAADRGLVNRLVPAGTDLEGAYRLAEEILANPPLSVRSVVRARRTRLELLTMATNIQTRDNRLPESEDFKEAVAAFREKRPGVFHAR
jgi:enoyl-CoA hydratase/carnithine racemase